MLTKQEIKAIWRACGELGPHEVAMNYGRMVRFLLLTAQRRDEAASLEFGDILDGTWRQVENKASRPHSIPLPPLAMDLVGKGDARDYVFGGRLGKIGGFSKLKRLLDKASGVSDWRLHDLRRTAATRMQELGVRDDIVQAVLNHACPALRLSICAPNSKSKRPTRWRPGRLRWQRSCGRCRWWRRKCEWVD